MECGSASLARCGREVRQTELVDDLLGRDERREFWREGWRRCAAFGIQGLPVPVEYGGKGFDLPVTIAAMEGLGFGCPDTGLIFAINACMWTNTIPILLYGTEEQKRRYLPGLCDGSLVGANLASEPEAGSDIYGMQTRAETPRRALGAQRPEDLGDQRPGGRPLRLLRLDRAREGRAGPGRFLIPRETPGLRVVREIPKLGVRTAPMGELALEDCELPPESLLGRVGRGAETFHCSMEWERGAILAGALGTMRRQLERCIEHARRRKQFGQPIGKFQAVADRIVDMAVRLETCRPLVYKVGWLKAQGRDATREAAMAKLHVSDCFVKNSLDAVQLFGAAGYVTEYGIERDLRDSVASLIASGTNDIQRNVIARCLRL